MEAISDMVIQFSVSEVRQHLLEKGRVYTFRKDYRHTGLTWANSGRGTKKLCEVVVTLVSPVTLRKGKSWMDKYVVDSGFLSVSDWLKAIEKVNGGSLPSKGYLYLVEKVNP